MLKRIKWQEIVLSLMMMLGGAYLVWKPDVPLELISRCIGAAILILGIILLIGYFVSRGIIGSNHNMVTGIILIVIGIYCLTKPAVLVSIIPVFLGLVITISGVMKLQHAFDLRRIGAGWTGLLITAAINILIGLLLVLNPFKFAALLTRLLGIGLAASGLTELITSIYLSSKINKYYVDAEARELSPEELRQRRRDSDIDDEDDEGKFYKTADRYKEETQNASGADKDENLYHAEYRDEKRSGLDAASQKGPDALKRDRAPQDEEGDYHF